MSTTPTCLRLGGKKCRVLGVLAKQLFASIHIQWQDSKWIDFHETSYLGFLLKCIATCQFWLKLNKNNRHIRQTHTNVCNTSVFVVFIAEKQCSVLGVSQG
jgi:hypothetical protein